MCGRHALPPQPAADGFAGASTVEVGYYRAELSLRMILKISLLPLNYEAEKEPFRFLRRYAPGRRPVYARNMRER